jgi:hypothetical protein
MAERAVALPPEIGAGANNTPNNWRKPRQFDAATKQNPPGFS